jgi:cytochrome c oxidase assembly protein subunit 15
MDLAPGSRRAIGVWLLACCGMVAALVLVGGLTRLTHSGLSMVEWRPLMGILPPLNEAGWQEVFAEYRAYPEYQKLNSGMTLGDFKRIFAFEYVHRLLGRGIGVVFGLPMVWFMVRRRVSVRFGAILVGLFALGGMQGVVGWWMVRSGLVDRPDVSQYRLATHFGLALLIYALILWTALGVLRPRAADGDPARRSLARVATSIAVGVFITAISGAFVAGLDAGFAYNTFPLMGGRLVPVGLFFIDPWWRNVFENVTTVQFDHRWLAKAVLVAVVWMWWRSRAVDLSVAGRRAVAAVVFAAILQVALGIATLLSIVAVPIASAHQLGALALLTTAIVAASELRRG